MFFVSGHGNEEQPTGEAHLPEDLALHFYSPPGTVLKLANAAHIISTLAANGDSVTYDQSNPVPNYELYKFGNDGDVATLYTAADNTSGAELYVIGDHWPSPIKMCDGDDSECQSGVHTCEGLLGLFAEEGITGDIHVLACTGEGKSYLLPGEKKPDFYDATRNLVDKWAEMTAKGKAEQAVEEYRRLDPNRQAELYAFPEVIQLVTWAGAKEYLAAAGEIPFVRYYKSLDEAHRKLINWDVEIKAAIESVESLTDIFLSEKMSKEDRQEAWNELTEYERESWVALDARIDEWVTVNSSPVDEPDWPEVDKHNGSILYGALMDGSNPTVPYIFSSGRLLLGEDAHWWNVKRCLAGDDAITGSVSLVRDALRNAEGKIQIDDDGEVVLANTFTVYVRGPVDLQSFRAAVRRIPPIHGFLPSGVSSA